jgi:hypothetical protein
MVFGTTFPFRAREPRGAINRIYCNGGGVATLIRAFQVQLDNEEEVRRLKRSSPVE